MSNVPPVVAAGILPHREWDYLMEAARIDQSAFIAYAKELCTDNVPLWNTLFLGYDVTPHNVEIRGELRGYQQAMVKEPRSHSKSWDLVIGEITHDLAYSTVHNSGYRDPRLMLIQETATVVRDTIQGIRNTFESGGPRGMIGAAFGDFKARAAKWAEDRIWIGDGESVGKDPSLIGVGLKGAVTGKHPKKLFGDDIVTRENAKTAHLRTQQREWWKQTVQGMIDPGTQVRIVYTPYFEDDLNGWLERTKAFRVIERPALNRMPTMQDYEEVFDDKGVRVGVKVTPAGMDLRALWPCPLGTGNCPNTPDHYKEYGEHRSVEFLLKWYATDAFGFQSQAMLRLIDHESTQIRKEMLRFYSMDRDLIGQPAMPYNDSLIVPFPATNEIAAAVHGWDHAIGLKKKHDRTALARGYRTTNNDIFFMFKYGHWSFPKAVRMMESLFLTDPIRRPTKLVTEGINFQDAYSQVLLEEGGEILPIVTLKDQSDKAKALVESGLLNHIINGKVYFDIADTEAIAEFLNFTGEDGKFKDDNVDAARIAFTELRSAIKKKMKTYRGGSRTPLSF